MIVKKFKESSDNVKVTITIVSVLFGLMTFVGTTFLDPVKGEIKQVSKDIKAHLDSDHDVIDDILIDHDRRITANGTEISTLHNETEIIDTNLKEQLDRVERKQDTMSEDIKDILKELNGG